MPNRTVGYKNGMTRSLFLWHRYLGIALCGLFALWFVTGVAMLYVRMPILDPDARFALLTRVDPVEVAVTPAEAVAATGVTGEPRRIRLARLLDRPVYYLLPPGERWVGVWADTGGLVGRIDPAQARLVVGRHAPPGTSVRWIETVEGVDQWTLTNSLNLHRPLHRFAVGDEAGTEMYVSAQTGEIVMQSTRRERALAWIGPILHWGAPEFLRRHVWLWRQLLLWLSVAGVLLAITGLWLGIRRYRHRGYVFKGGGQITEKRSPYFGARLQHHWAGLLFGGVTFTWILSGLLYLNPGGRPQGELSTTTQVTPYSVGGIRGSTAPSAQQTAALRGGPLDAADWTDPPGAAWVRVGGRALPKEVELVRFATRPYYLFFSEAFESVAVPADGGDAPVSRHATEALLARASLAVPDGRIVEAELIDRYDAYYYSVGAVAPKRLPILRVRFDDPQRLLMYIDPHTGTIFRTYDRQARVMRWLVVALHCLDFPFLMFNRPAWDGVIIGLSAGGLALSVTGMLLGWRRIRPVSRGSLSMASTPVRDARRSAALLGLLAVLLSGSPGPAAAQAPPTGAVPDPDPAFRHLEDVVVTASRREERVSEVPATLQVFDRDQIERAGAASITEFLASQGVAFFSHWTPAQTSINIRGGATDGQGRDFRSQVVVLVNGRRAGTANLSKLGLDDLQRIEVVRGPGSLVHGSQALGGVVNLITRDGLRDPGTRLRLQAGAWGLIDGLAQHGFTAGRWDVFASAHLGRRGDYQAGRNAVERPQRNTSYRQGGGMIVVGYTWNGFQRIALTARTDGKYDAGFRGSSWDWDNVEDRINRSVDLVYSGERPGGRLAWETQAFGFDDLDDFRWGSEVIRSGDLARPGFDLDHNRRRQRGVGVRGSTTARLGSVNALTVGLDTEWTRLRNSRRRVPVPGGPTSQVPPFDNDSNSHSTGVWVEDVHRLFADRLVLRGGVRMDGGRHDLRETEHQPLLRPRRENYDALTYRAGMTFKPGPGVAVRAQAGTGYRAPTPTELAADFTTPLGGQILGNPDLGPERASSLEAGVAIERGRAWVDVALFRNDLSDRIASVPVAPGSNRSVFVNRSASRVRGLEWQARVDLLTLGAQGRVWAGVNGVHHFVMRDLDASARGLNSDRIERMYRSQASTSVGLTAPACRLLLTGTFHGAIWYDTEENLLVPEAEPSRTFIHRKDPFWLWSLQGQRAVGRGVWITVSVTNLLDANVHPLFVATNAQPTRGDTRFSNGGAGNSLPGRSLVVGLEVRP